MRRLLSVRTLTFAGSLLFGASVLFFIGSIEVTSKPQFCGACHVMRPYFESWKGSKHNKIACVDCHIPPGLESELRKKYEAVSMVVRYFTGTYGTNPWAEVDDVSCLKCHERRLIAGKELFRGILFNHTPHLTELRRGKKLRCTSCHSQIVQGSHIAVTTSTCVLCHFKDQPVGSSTARCQLCHVVPDKVITRKNIEFNHAEVKRFDMKCEWCHASVITGEGDVPKTRCYACHSEPARIEKYEEEEELHKIHVTEHKVECLHCHNEIQHTIQKEIQAAETSCESCHGGGHSPQRSLYAGIGGKGVHPLPNPMYVAGITCEGCHFLPKQRKGEEIMRASEISCMTCHGAAFGRIFKRWQTVVAERLTQSKELLHQTEARLSPPYPQAYRDARDNISLVEDAHPIHNVDYTLILLDKSAELMNQSLKEQKKSALPISWNIMAYSSPCLSCHQGIETQQGMFAGRPFDHYPHVIRNQLNCEKCHQPHQIPLKGERNLPATALCAGCHHEPRFEKACQGCHEADITRGIVVQGEVLDRKGLTFDHAMHREATGLKCAECHTEAGKFRPTPVATRCADCHG